LVFIVQEVEILPGGNVPSVAKERRGIGLLPVPTGGSLVGARWRIRRRGVIAMVNDETKAKLREQCQRLHAGLVSLIELLEREVGLDEKAHTNLEPLTDRQYWILDQLRHGVELTRQMVEKQFGIGDKQAKRTLTALTNRSMIKFVRKPRPGHYVLRRKVMSTARNQRGAGKRQRASDATNPDGGAPEVTIIPFSQAIAAKP